MAMFVATSAKPNRGARGPYVQNPYDIYIWDDRGKSMTKNEAKAIL